jgi:hypothetical protein
VVGSSQRALVFVVLSAPPMDYQKQGVEYVISNASDIVGRAACWELNGSFLSDLLKGDMTKYNSAMRKKAGGTDAEIKEVGKQFA